MTKNELLELQRLLCIIKVEHPEYIIVLTEDKESAETMISRSHEPKGKFSIELDYQVEICLDDESNTNL